MKKIILALLCCALLVATVACNKSGDIVLTNTSEAENIFSTSNCTISHEESNNEELPPENTKLIQSEKHFQIYRYNDTINKHFYRILDTNGSTVFSETTTRPLSINITEDNIIDISISFGSGVCEHRYYNIGKNILSECFEDVFATSGELIAYMNVPNSTTIQSRTLIIQNIFDRDLFVEFKLDFSNYAIPIEKIEFLENYSLQITYYKGSEQELITEILNYG